MALNSKNQAIAEYFPWWDVDGMLGGSIGGGAGAGMANGAMAEGAVVGAAALGGLIKTIIKGNKAAQGAAKAGAAAGGALNAIEQGTKDMNLAGAATRIAGLFDQIYNNIKEQYSAMVIDNVKNETPAHNVPGTKPLNPGIEMSPPWIKDAPAVVGGTIETPAHNVPGTKPLNPGIEMVPPWAKEEATTPAIPREEEITMAPTIPNEETTPITPAIPNEEEQTPTPIIPGIIPKEEAEMQDTTNENVETQMPTMDWLKWVEEQQTKQWAREDQIRKETQTREDNAYQRAVEDMRKSGINPNLMNVQPASAGGGITNATGVNTGILEAQIANDTKMLQQLIDNAFKGDENSKDRFTDTIGSLLTSIIFVLGPKLFK